MSLFNPFTELSHFRARIYRTTFRQKLLDTFRVFCGSIHKSPIFAGVFDYLTLGIPRLLSGFLFNLDTFLNKISPKIIISKILVELSQLLILALKFLFLVPRLLFGVTLTIICLPLIGIIHALNMKKGHEIKESIYNSQVIRDLYVLSIILDANSAPQGHRRCFIYLVNKNELWGYDAFGNARLIPIEKNKIELFKTTFHVDQASQEVSKLLFVQRNILKQFLPPGAAAASETYYSVAERLKSEDTTLEDIESSKLTVNINDAHEKEITVSFMQDKKIIPSFFLSAKNPADRSLFQNIRKLNIGEIEAAIEQSPGSQEIITPFTMAALK